MRIIGISGRREAGKDTLARGIAAYLSVKSPGTRVRIASTADWPRLILHRFCGVPMENLAGTNAQKCVPLPCGINGREALRRLINVLRTVDPMCLIRNVIEESESIGIDILIMPCVRNRTDCDGIRAAGGSLVRLSRAVHPADTFPEELELDDYDGWDIVIPDLPPRDVLREFLEFSKI